MGLRVNKEILIDLAQAIRDANVDRFYVLTNNVVVDFGEKIDCGNGKAPFTLIDCLSVLLKAKNKDSYLQSLFVERLWSMFSSPHQKKLMKKYVFSLLPLMFLRERNQKSLDEQLNMFFQEVSQHPHDTFLSNMCSLVNIFQNPYLKSIDCLLENIKSKRNGFDFIKCFKVKDQCYYQKHMLAQLLNYMLTNGTRNVSVEALYSACNNISFCSVCPERGILEVYWTTYCPSEVQKGFENLLMKKLNLHEDYREFIPLVVTSKKLRELKDLNKELNLPYKAFIERTVLEFYNKKTFKADRLFQILKRLNIYEEAYLPLMTRHYVGLNLNKVISNNVSHQNDCNCSGLLGVDLNVSPDIELKSYKL